MAKHDDAFGVSGAETMIGAGVEMEGTLSSGGDIAIDGRFKGQITTSGDVMLGVNAQVTATIHGRNVSVAGHLTGNIEAVGEAAVRESGHVKGNINCASLMIQSGGVFLGQSQMQSAPLLELPEADRPVTE